MKKLEGNLWFKRVSLGLPWIGVVFLFGYILWLNIPLISLSTRGCAGTDCSLGIASVKNTQESWEDGQFSESSEVLHVKKRGLEFSFLNPPAAQHVSLVLEWQGETTQSLQVNLSSDKDFVQNVLTATPTTTELKDDWQRISVQFDLPEQASRKWFVQVEGSQGHAVRSIQVNVLSDPSLFAKLHSWWRNTHI